MSVLQKMLNINTTFDAFLFCEVQDVDDLQDKMDTMMMMMVIVVVVVVVVQLFKQLSNADQSQHAIKHCTIWR
jgi:hypothetical protein